LFSRAIVAHFDLVSGFFFQPTQFVAVKSKSTCLSRRREVSRTGYLSFRRSVRSQINAAHHQEFLGGAFVAGESSPCYFRQGTDELFA